MRWLAAMGTAAAFAVVGCGGGSASSGTGGRGGEAGATEAGGTGGGAAGKTGSGGSGLPACAIGAVPNDRDAGVCNSITLTGATLVAEPFVGTTSGIVLDGGAIEMPMGGTILDGDYDLVRWQDVSGATRRTMRVFSGGTYFEWAGADFGFSPDGGGEIDFRYDTTEHVNGTSLVVDQLNCTDGTNADDFGFTASGDTVVFFNSAGTSTVFAVDTYRRTCTRP